MGVNTLWSAFTVVRKGARRSRTSALSLLLPSPAPVYSSFFVHPDKPETCGAGGWDGNSPYAFFCSWGMKRCNRNILAMPKRPCLNTGLSFTQPNGWTSLYLDFRTEPAWEPGLHFCQVSLPGGQLGCGKRQPTENRQKSSLTNSSIWHSLWRSLRHLVSHKYCREPWPCCETSI